MPQFDIFFFFNFIFYFFTFFIIFYLTMSYYFLPKILSVLKLRKQKFDYLSKLIFFSKMRWISLNSNIQNTTISVCQFFSSFIKKIL